MHHKRYGTLADRLELIGHYCEELSVAILAETRRLLPKLPPDLLPGMPSCSGRPSWQSGVTETDHTGRRAQDRRVTGYYLWVLGAPDPLRPAIDRALRRFWSLLLRQP